MVKTKLYRIQPTSLNELGYWVGSKEVRDISKKLLREHHLSWRGMRNHIDMWLTDDLRIMITLSLPQHLELAEKQIDDR